MRILALCFALVACAQPTAQISPWTMTASSGAVKAVSASISGSGINIYHVSGSWDNSSTVTLEYGTGTKCGSGTTVLWGPSGGLVTVALDFRSPPHIPPGNDFCISFGSSVTGGGGVVYDYLQ